MVKSSAATGKGALMIRYLALSALLLPAAGCNSEPKTYRVTGTVKWNGAPIPSGQINFISTDGQTTPSSSKIVDGRYELWIAPGQKRVEVFSQRSKGYDKVMKQETYVNEIPLEYNAKSGLTFEVLPHNENVYDAALPLPAK